MKGYMVCRTCNASYRLTKKELEILNSHCVENLPFDAECRKLTPQPFQELLFDDGEKRTYFYIGRYPLVISETGWCRVWVSNKEE